MARADVIRIIGESAKHLAYAQKHMRLPFALAAASCTGKSGAKAFSNGKKDTSKRLWSILVQLSFSVAPLSSAPPLLSQGAATAALILAVSAMCVAGSTAVRFSIMVFSCAISSLFELAGCTGAGGVGCGAGCSVGCGVRGVGGGAQANPPYLPVGQMGWQRAAPASLSMPVSHATQRTPLPAAYWPDSHMAHVVVVALVLPRGAPVPAAHGVPTHAARAPVPVVWVPLGQATQVVLQRHVMELLQAVVLTLRVLK